MPRVLVVSPLPAVRAGLRAILGLADDVAVVGEAECYDPAAASLAEPGPEVVVVDPDPAFSAGDLASADPIERGPGPVILGPVPEDHSLAAELAGRPWAYVPRGASGEQILAAVRAVAHGLVAIDPSVGGHLLGQAGGPQAVSPDSELDEELTAREREVLQLVALGLANKTIAARLGISEHTVKFHVAAILAKLGAASRTEAVHLGARRGLVAL
jgi:DNA-binding NarL/FixJ family response regulator